MTKSTGTTLGEALAHATRYWTSKGPSSRMMPLRASRVIALAGFTLTTPIAGLTASSGTHILTSLAGLSKSSQGAYYSAFRRMLALSGVLTIDWPAAGSPPRRVREPIGEEDLGRLISWLSLRRFSETSALARLLLGTGMRVEVEALSRTAIQVSNVDDTLRVTGKGGHERIIPVSAEVAGLVRYILPDIRSVPYPTHLKRWKQGVAALGIASKLPTPHSVRHLYATKAYARCGDLHVVKELLGHADINTTARYVGVDMERMRHAAGA